MDLVVERSRDCKLWTVCRLCLEEGCSRKVTQEYYHAGKKEVYEDMLKDTFGIKICHTADERVSRLICEGCVQKLRDASIFKNTVIKSEQVFVEYIAKLKHDVEETSHDLMVPQIKVEPLPLTEDGLCCDDEDGDDSYDDDEVLANIKMEMSTEKANGPTLNTVEKRKKKSTKLKRFTGKVSEKGTNEKTQKDWKKIVERRGNGPILRENSLKLLANSTICVFQWNKSRYRCFCCKEPFSDMEKLRHHTEVNHTLENIEKMIIVQQNRLVKVEVSMLHCRLCEKNMENLTKLREHLSKEHKIEFSLKEDLLVPFKIQNSDLLQCQICMENFSVFRHLNIHMNRHYQKQVCHICGAGFSNLVFLNLHKTRSHRQLKCKDCDTVFTSKTEKRSHDITIHGVKIQRKLRFPCPYCSERFYQENFRVQHLVDKHGMSKPEFKCALCSKVYITKSLCNNHMKSVHMKEKKHECDVCHNRFYTRSDVLRHKVTHTGEKKFSCLLCNSLFASKDSLRRHMKRTHVEYSK